MTVAKPQLAFTVDLEDWAQSTLDRDRAPTKRCAYQARRILELLAEVPDARATFFVLGKFAERHPEVVRDIHASGHEIACHGWGHVEAFRLGRERFTKDLYRATEAIGNITGFQPKGYRASDFSVVSESLWALDVLRQAGYEYSSSIFPILKARYGIPSWPRHPTCVELSSGRSIIEAPLATLEFLGRRLPVAGGGYGRLLPASVLTHAFRHLSNKGGFPVFYCHPYEVDSEEFELLDGLDLPPKLRLHQGIGRKRFSAKLRRLLGQFHCVALGHALSPCVDLPRLCVTDYAQTATQSARPIFLSRS
jgi:polysaccharide deacetylase family protein (PEP-CTERM system associated)